MPDDRQKAVSILGSLRVELDRAETRHAPGHDLMNDRENLPAKTRSGHLISPKEQPSSLVARGLEALKRRQELKLAEPEGPPDTIRTLHKAAEQGDAEAQLNLGWEYHTGNLIPRDCDQALDWWRKSADQGCVAAQNSLGWSYSIAKEYVEAYFWLGLAHNSTSEVGPKVISNSYYTDPYHIQFFIEELRSRRSDDGRSELQVESDTLRLTPIEIARNIEPLMTLEEIAEAEYSIGQAYREGDIMLVRSTGT